METKLCKKHQRELEHRHRLVDKAAGDEAKAAAYEFVGELIGEVQQCAACQPGDPCIICRRKGFVRSWAVGTPSLQVRLTPDLCDDCAQDFMTGVARVLADLRLAAVARVGGKG